MLWCMCISCWLRCLTLLRWSAGSILPQYCDAATHKAVMTLRVHHAQRTVAVILDWYQFSWVSDTQFTYGANCLWLHAQILENCVDLVRLDSRTFWGGSARLWHKHTGDTPHFPDSCVINYVHNSNDILCTQFGQTIRVVIQLGLLVVGGYRRPTTLLTASVKVADSPRNHTWAACAYNYRPAYTEIQRSYHSSYSSGILLVETLVGKPKGYKHVFSGSVRCELFCNHFESIQIKLYQANGLRLHWLASKTRWVWSSTTWR